MGTGGGGCGGGATAAAASVAVITGRSATGGHRSERDGGDTPGGSGDRVGEGAPGTETSPSHGRGAGGARAAAAVVCRHCGRLWRRVNVGRPPWASLPKGGGMAARGVPQEGAAGGVHRWRRISGARPASGAATRVGRAPAVAAAEGSCDRASADGGCRHLRAS